jgi:hypothetical protein
VHKDGATIGGIGARGRAAVDLADDGVALFYEAEEVGRVCRGAEVRPAGVLELCDFAHALEGLVGVGEGEFADDDVGLFCA